LNSGLQIKGKAVLSAKMDFWRRAARISRILKIRN
jgi:hypothetical protein